jgi:hypothetical protein
MVLVPRAAKLVGGAAALVTATMFGAATPATAAPTAAAAAAQPSACQVRVYEMQYRVVAFCDAGTGRYRAKTRCDKSFAPDYNRYGPWRPAGGPEVSKAQCNDGDEPFNAGYQTA